MPEFLSVPRYRDGKITATNNYTFPATQVAFDVIFYAASRGFSLPIFYAFLYMLLFLCCEVEKFKDDLGDGHYPSEDEAKKKAYLKIRTFLSKDKNADQGDREGFPFFPLVVHSHDFIGFSTGNFLHRGKS